jgi:hypothetical protein
MTWYAMPHSMPAPTPDEGRARKAFALQATLLRLWAACGQAVLPIGGVSVGCGLDLVAGVMAAPTIWPRSLIPVGTMPWGAVAARWGGIATGV